MSGPRRHGVATRPPLPAVRPARTGLRAGSRLRRVRARARAAARAPRTPRRAPGCSAGRLVVTLGAHRGRRADRRRRGARPPPAGAPADAAPATSTHAHTNADRRDPPPTSTPAPDARRRHAPAPSTRPAPRRGHAAPPALRAARRAALPVAASSRRGAGHGRRRRHPARASGRGDTTSRRAIDPQTTEIAGLDITAALAGAHVRDGPRRRTARAPRRLPRSAHA